MIDSKAGGSCDALEAVAGSAVRGGGPSAVESCSIHGTEAGLAAAPVAAPPAVSTSLATLLTRHVLRDGEIILLILKPSLWTILFNSLPAVAAALIVMISTGLWLPHHTHTRYRSRHKADRPPRRRRH